jgi:hypothetical protein
MYKAATPGLGDIQASPCLNEGSGNVRQRPPEPHGGTARVQLPEPPPARVHPANGVIMNPPEEAAPEDPAETLRAFADDLEADAREFDVTEPHEGGVATGLGRAVGKARQRAEQIEDEDDKT